MNSVIVILVVIFVVIGKFRELLKSPGDQRSDDPERLSRGSGDASSATGDAFSLQQVLAEIQKVKDQANRGETLSASQIRDRVQRASVSDQKKRELAERAAKRREEIAAGTLSAGPTGRRASVQLQSDPSPEDEAATAPAVLSLDVPTPVSGGPASSTPATAPARLSVDRLREATIWREVLSPPLSLRDE